MNKKKKILKVFIILILIVALGGLGYFIYKQTTKKPNIPVKVVEVLDTIKGYDYKLEDRDTELFKEKFKKLKNTLESEEIDYEEYAKILAELFVIDLYTIENKNSKYDVGSLDFIYEEEQEKFKNKVMDSMYKLVEDNSTNTRKQELPIVKNVSIVNTKETTYQKGETKLSGYEIQLEIVYEKELGYDQNVKITLVKDQEKVYVVSLSNE